MAKREISSTLKNLKFMQRAIQKEEKANIKEEEEVTPAGNFPSSTAVKRCVVIVEGDPHPGAARGRMSFLSFNPSIDKLNNEESDPSQTESTPTNSGRKSEKTSIRENGSSEDRLDDLELDASNNDANMDLKRKQADVELEATNQNKSKKSFQGNHRSSPSSSHSSQKKHKREKVDWNVLRPPKYPSKKK
ncbi:hypothetical protein ACJIZ3_017911 [Penstemon smallii]|uniref:M-phase phosphoprotein 6 n=1 Tax=Penstemon smallii TaxID=265156 RepID=A0ABD3SWX3_9LAMI